jgi:hypothetical protein
MFLPIFMTALVIALWVGSVFAMIGLIGGTEFVVNDSDIFTSIASYTDNKLYMFYYYVFATLWVNSFLQAVAVFVVASACCLWYFSHGVGDSLDSPITQGFKLILRYHFGSLAFGSLIIAII